MNSVEKFLSRDEDSLNRVDVQKWGNSENDFFSKKNTSSKRSNFNMNTKGLMLLPIILFEIFICAQSFDYYKNQLQFTILGALALALCVEGFYMYYSTQRGFKANIMKYFLLAISVFSLAYTTYSSDENIVNTENAFKVERKSIESEIVNINKQVNSYNNELNDISSQMKIYIEKELLTKGNAVLGPRKKEIESNLEKLSGSLESLNNKLKGNANNSNLSIVENIKTLTSKTLITIIVFFLIQVSICVSLADIVDSLKHKEESLKSRRDLKNFQ